MLDTPDPWNQVAPAYEAELVPAFERFARDALAAAALSESARVLDVAAGPGTLAILAAQAGGEVTAVDFAPRMIDALRARAGEAGLGIDARVADGCELPFAEASFDAAFSLFGLMFFPDRARGFRELHRVLAPGGRALVSSWQPFDRCREMVALYGGFAELSNAPKREGGQPLSDPAICEREMSEAGFRGVIVRELEARLTYPSTDAMIDSTVRSSAPLMMAKRAMGERWDPLIVALRERVNGLLGSGPQEVTLGAYLTTGTR